MPTKIIKRFGLFIVGLFALFFAGNFSLANNEYEHTNLNISANILQDGTVNVTEKFTTNFFVDKHGIIRNIPLNYSIGGTVFHIDVSDINVKGKTFTTDQFDGEIEIKIGDADKTITGEETYQISYSTYGLIKNYSGMGYSELYWNLVGNQFDTDIKKVRAVIFLPEAYTGFTSDDFLITTDGSTESVEDFKGKVDRSHGDRIVITYDEGLPAYRGITLAIKFPNGYFEFDHDRQSGLLGRAKDDYNVGYASLNIVPSISESSVESDSMQEDLLPEINDEPSDETEAETNTENSADEEKVELSFNTITSNNYVSSGPKTKPKGNSEYEYKNLDIRANISVDGTMDVSENFTADFHVNKHGIIRAIPLNYTVAGYDFHIDVSNINVTGKRFSTSKKNGEIEIKIGDPDRTVIGEQEYPISYTTYGLIRNFSGQGYAELYWNLVGFDFDTSINNVKADIYLPKTYTGFKPDDFLISVDGKSTSIYDFQGLVDWKGGNKITITYDRGLSSYNGITLSIKFPSDYFEFDHDRQAKLAGRANNSLLNRIGNFLSRIAGFFCLIFGAIFLGKRVSKGKTDKIDTKSGLLTGELADKYPVIVQYEPPKGLSSAEVGLLLHREAKAKDLFSLIYKRAAEGLISISVDEDKSFLDKLSKKETIILTKNKDIGEVPLYEKDFFKALIRSENNKITTSSNLYSKLSLRDFAKHGESKGWFTNNKKQNYLAIAGGVVLYFIHELAGEWISDNFPWLSVVLLFGFIYCIVMIAKTSKLKETEEGAKLISHILGYREFLSMCDENKLRLFLQQDPLYFDKILPYAVVFGLETELIKKMEPIMQEMNIKSSWYDGDINNIYIINNTISSAAIHSVPSYDSSSGFGGGSSFGGGFSIGGGGGGGGGRSW